jgi:hypothetical protein
LLDGSEPLAQAFNLRPSRLLLFKQVVAPATVVVAIALVLRLGEPSDPLEADPRTRKRALCIVDLAEYFILHLMGAIDEPLHLVV